MFACPTCATPVGGSEPACPACGSDLDIAESPTGTAPQPSPRTPAGEKPRTPSNGGGRLSGERFVPGTVIAERYRITGLLGRGGMGEVYRADDLKLEQPVALKFLPHGLDSDGERLARFYREVRTARQVSHPAVCRVYDVAEADEHFFLSMELVDGENLASLLRRIGRLPPDKALEIARQLCAGLAAAHEKGVLHRDLKPANVMLDGQGNVRITDFGLAGLAESLRHGDVRSGTPCYMSPEQLTGREVTVRSDIYSLGLVLYELYTGRRAFEGKSLAEYTRKHRDERPIEPSALVAGLDPAVERAILSCLEKEPRRRPASPHVVAAMLTGRDPLEAALAAGETPSPELVASAGEAHGLRPAIAWSLLGLTFLGLVFVRSPAPPTGCWSACRRGRRLPLSRTARATSSGAWRRTPCPPTTPGASAPSGATRGT
jgi:serine/threonine-protein kinase